MKIPLKMLAVSATILLMPSFTAKNAYGFIGTYGVSASDPAQIRLTINADHTFYYQDFSDANKKIIVNGTWSLKGKKVVLKGNDSKTKFHTIWTFDESGQVARSRRGLTFYTLGKTGSQKNGL